MQMRSMGLTFMQEGLRVCQDTKSLFEEQAIVNCRFVSDIVDNNGRKDFPIETPIKPPWKTTWLECDSDSSSGVMLCALVQMLDIPEDHRLYCGKSDILQAYVSDTLRGFFQNHDLTNRQFDLSSKPLVCSTMILPRYAIAVRLIVIDSSHKFGMCTGMLYAYLDENGKTNDASVGIVDVLGEDTDFDSRMQVRAANTKMSWIVLYSLSLMNCKNIVISQTNVDRHSTHRNRTMRKGIIYKVLKVKSSSVKNHRTVLREFSLDHNAIHMCRGHFKTFTTEKPLLGKHTGTYWWAPHMRGKNRNAEVKKTYLIASA
jgi:hypothetical protein